MPNLYATHAELKLAAPDGMRAAVTKYDTIITRLLSGVSRWMDNECKRVFFPTAATRRYRGSGGCRQRVPDLIAITSVEISNDGGLTYAPLTADDYIPMVEDDENSRKSYTVLEVNVNSTTLSAWPAGQRAIKIAGVWGYADDRDTAWESTGDEVENNPLAAGGTSLLVNDVDGLDIYGVLPRFQGGQILKIEDEFIEASMTINTVANTLGIARGRNGTAAAAHAQNTAISVWKPPEPIRDAVIIQATRQLERGMQGFGDSKATPEMSQILYFRQLDPEAAGKLAPYRLMEFS